jgi:hypothetical protein
MLKFRLLCSSLHACRPLVVHLARWCMPEAFEIFRTSAVGAFMPSETSVCQAFFKSVRKNLEECSQNSPSAESLVMSMLCFMHIESNGLIFDIAAPIFAVT